MLAAPRPPREGRARGGGGGGSSFVAQRLAQAGLDSDFLSEAPQPSSRHRRGGYAEADDIEAPSSDVYGRHASRRDSRYGRQNWDDYDDGEVRNCPRQPPPALGSTCRCGCRSDDRSVASQEEGPSPEWHVPIEVGFSLLCAYGCLSYSALIFGHPAMLAP